MGEIYKVDEMASMCWGMEKRRMQTRSVSSLSQRRESRGMWVVLGSLRSNSFHPHPSPLPRGEGVVQEFPCVGMTGWNSKLCASLGPLEFR